MKQNMESEKNAILDKSAIILFENSRNAIRAEYVLKKQGFSVNLVAPPPKIRKGCDISVKVDAKQQIYIMKVLDKEGISYIDLIAFTGEQAPVELTTIKEFEDYFMVRSGNMKITVSKENGTIVNISGGGCPDIPYIAQQIINTNVVSAVRPIDLGSSLCAYLLDRAFLEAKRTFLEQE